jgi:hypothetical protein
MSTICVIYGQNEDSSPYEPNFPATAQHPDAQRYLVGQQYVDAIGGQPTPAEVDAVLNLNPPAAPTEAEQLVQKIKDDPVALDKLKQALK